MVEFIKNYWYFPIMLLILITGIILTIKLKGIQFRRMGVAIKLLFHKGKVGKGEISNFGALCISLSATIGTGNIVGVATAVALGGPGTIFWMLLISLFGLATKYAEGFLAIKYRYFKSDGTVSGGPFAYIEKGLGSRFKYLAKIFAIFGAMSALIGIGTMTQSNGITEAFSGLFETTKSITIFNQSYSLLTIIIGVVITILVALVIIGGIKRISKICEYCVPIMAIIYILCGILILINNITLIPNALWLILKGAFNPSSIAGGALGYTIAKCISNGAQKGIFANEAGLGSTPIALASSQNDNPKKEGLISMGGMLITMIICLMTGLVIIVTDSYSLGLEGIHITNNAFVTGLFFSPIVSEILLLLCITFFAITTIIGWNLYGMKCINYLFNDNKVISTIYMIIYIIMIFLGSLMKIDTIWLLADISNGLMAIPNLIALIGLSNKVKEETEIKYEG